MQPEPGWPETRLLGADFGRYTGSLRRLFPILGLPWYSHVEFSCASSQRRVRSVAESGVARGRACTRS